MHFDKFANDAKVLASDTVNIELVAVDNWVKANRHSLYVSKFSNMISNQKNRCNRIKICYSIHTKVSTVKFLGITLAENFTCNDLVSKVTTKTSTSVAVMRLSLPVACRRNA